jgi:hypothetical protein
MEGSQNNASNSQPIPKNVHEQTNVCKDGINLIDYLRVLQFVWQAIVRVDSEWRDFKQHVLISIGLLSFS